MSDNPTSLIQVVAWFLGGVILGGGIGWQLRIAYEARAAAEKAAEKTVEMEDLIVHNIQPEWNGEDRRRGDEGKADYGSIFIVCLFIFALLSSVLGVVVATRAQDQAQCYTEVNAEFAEVFETRQVDAGELERTAEAIDRKALDVLVSTIARGAETKASTGEDYDIRPFLVTYRAEREASEQLRTEAMVIREENPYPSAKRCDR